MQEVERPSVLNLSPRLKAEEEHVGGTDTDYDLLKLSDSVQSSLATDSTPSSPANPGPISGSSSNNNNNNNTTLSSKQYGGGQLSPNLQPSTPTSCVSPSATLLAGKYLLIEQPEGSALARCVNTVTQEELVCKVIGREAGNVLLASYYRVDAHPHINALHEVLLGEHNMYLLFPPSYGDLHSHVRLRKRIREPEARRFFRQMTEAVRACHEQGIVMRDLKLRKFVFVDQQRSELKLESLEDAVVLEDSDDDIIQDKRGCPAYVSPEILRSHAQYSGRAADMWSLGVILYTMLVGRYPFNDSEHISLFAKISRGHFIIPDCLSSRAKCLIRSLLRREPSERLSASDVLLHPWLTREERYDTSRSDQMVPEFNEI